MKIVNFAIFSLLAFNFSFGQEFNNLLKEDYIKDFFKSAQIQQNTKYEWGYTFVHSDSLYLYKTSKNYNNLGFSISMIYRVSEDDDPKNHGYKNYFAFDIVENTVHDAKSLYKKYKVLLKTTDAFKISLIGFHVIKDKTDPIVALTKSTKAEVISTGNILIKGQVLDSLSNQPIPYVNIGFFEKNIGTVSDANGFFQLAVPSSMVKNLLTISCLGYKTKELAIQSNLSSGINLFYLQENVTSLQEVIVSAKALKFKTKTMGVNNVNGRATGFITGKGAGAEIARLIKNNRKIRVKSVSIYIGKNNQEEFQLRMNLYSMDSLTKLPSKNLLPSSIIVNSNIHNGWLTVNLDTPLYFYDDFFIAFEWINNELQNPLIALKGNKSDGRVYQRSISLGKWTTSSDFNWALQCEIDILD